MALDQLHEQEHQEKKAGEMSFFEHIAELRKHILRSFLAISVVGTYFLVNKDLVFKTILMGPVHQDFLTYRAMCGFSKAAGWGEKLCFSPVQLNLNPRQLGEVLVQHLFVSFWLGLIVSFPFIFWEFWKFIRPGLHETEAKAIRGVIGICSLLFFLGVAFGYFVIAPFSINFLAGYTVEGITVTPTLDSYVTYMTMFTLPTGLVFEMPVVAYFFARLGLIGPAFLRTYRRHAIVIILIVAALITPPDVVSCTIVFIPLYILYEISILVTARVRKNQEKALQLKAVQPAAPLGDD